MSKEIKKLNFTNVGDGIYELEVEEEVKLEDSQEVAQVLKSRLSLDLPKELIIKMKRKALDEGVTLTALFTRFAEDYTNDSRT